ncbi:unnamed protein product [Brassica rapa subsp. narinosa]
MSDSYSASLFEANEETRVQTHFDVGANVEIASKDEDRYVKWYPGIVLKTYIRTGVEMLKVEYSTRFRDKEKRTKKLQKSVSIDSIRPQPLPGDTKGFELMDKVEAYHNDGCSTEFIQFNHGVWKMEKEIEIHFNILIYRFLQQTQSVKPRQDDHAKKGKHVVGTKRKATAQLEKHVVGMKRKATALPVDRVKEEKYVVGMKRKATAQLCMPLYINGNKIEKDFFEYLDYEENNLKFKIYAAFAMLNQKRIEQSSWFSEQSIPKA